MGSVLRVAGGRGFGPTPFEPGSQGTTRILNVNDAAVVRLQSRGRGVQNEGTYQQSAAARHQAYVLTDPVTPGRDLGIAEFSSPM